MATPKVATAETGSTTEAQRLEIKGLSKGFKRAGGDLVGAVNNVDLTVKSGEIVVLLGPSGCGKSTLLRCIAGLDEPDRGTVSIDGKLAFDGAAGFMASPDKRNVSMMFQSYALWPHMTLQENVAYPLTTRGTSKSVARARALEYLELVGLQGLGQQYPGNISGGQQQRVALARTLISDPSVVLFDEPLSNVDAKVRVQLRRELLRIHSELGFAAIYVTHDQDEAMGIGNRIAVMREGRIVQLDDPVSIYEHPASRYAAEFVGAANLIEAKFVKSDGSKAIFDSPIGQIVADAARVWIDEAPAVGTAVVLMVRPEYCVISPDTSSSGENTWKATIDRTIYAGSRTEFFCTVGDNHLAAWTLGAAPALREATAASFHIPSDAVRVIEVGGVSVA